MGLRLRVNNKDDGGYLLLESGAKISVSRNKREMLAAALKTG